jgi:hypothetical protein
MSLPAICTVNSITLPTSGVTGLDVDASTTITIELTDTSGVKDWSIYCSMADGYNIYSTAPLVNATRVRVSTYKVTFVMPAMWEGWGSAVQFTSATNKDPKTVFTFGVFVRTVSGYRMFFAGEGLESNIPYGVSYDINALTKPVALGAFTAGGDLSGTETDQTVIGLQTRPVSGIAPTDGYVLTWNGSVWLPLPTAGGVAFSNDLSGSDTAQTVKGLYNNPLSSTAPVQSAVPVWDTGVLEYDIRKLTLDDLGPAFAITAFYETGGISVVEVGVTVTNPSFTASYSSSPGSANITNSYNIDSPLNLISPYTSGTVVGAFTAGGSAVTYVSFTLQAIAATTQYDYTYIYWEIRDYGGVGAAGATSSVTSSVYPATATATLSTGDVLSDQGLFYGPEGIGTLYGPFSPSAQKIYLLLQGGSHTFKDANTGFGFAFNAPTTVTFTNQYGVSGITMYLYESQFLLSATFTIEVAS